MYKKYIEIIINENKEISDDNTIYQNSIFLKEIADTALICVGFKNKKLSNLEHGSFIAGEIEFLKRFKNFKIFLGNTDIKIPAIKGNSSISNFIKRERIFLKKRKIILQRRLQVLNKSKNKLSSQDQIRKKELNNQLNYLNSKIKLLEDSLLNIEELISLLNNNFAKLKKIRKNKSFFKKIINKNDNSERELIKNNLINNLNTILNKFKQNIKFIDFKSYLSQISKLKIIESSMSQK